jgi:hypothetical protein
MLYFNMAPFFFLVFSEMVHFIASIFSYAHNGLGRQKNSRSTLSLRTSSTLESILHIAISVQLAKTSPLALLALVYAELQNLLSCGYVDTSSRLHGISVMLPMGRTSKDIGQGQLFLTPPRMRDQRTLRGIQAWTVTILVEVVTIKANTAIEVEVGMAKLGIRGIGGMLLLDRGQVATSIRGISSGVGKWPGMAHTHFISGARRLSKRVGAWNFSSFCCLPYWLSHWALPMIGSLGRHEWQSLEPLPAFVHT